MPCQRRWKFELPNNYITSGKHPQKTLDIGTWNLEAKMPEGILYLNFFKKSIFYFNKRCLNGWVSNISFTFPAQY